MMNLVLHCLISLLYVKKKKNTNLIDIDSKDEFGIMAKEINDNIKTTSIDKKKKNFSLQEVKQSVENLEMVTLWYKLSQSVNHLKNVKTTFF